MSHDVGERPRPLPDLAPPDFVDPVVEAYKKAVDRTLLRENLKLTHEQRVLKAQSVHRAIDAVRGAARPTKRNNDHSSGSSTSRPTGA
jgi:hypothetical protein